VTLSRDEIRAGFCFLLGHEPSERAIAELSNLDDLGKLRHLLIHTDAFRDTLYADIALMPLTAPPLEIETEVAPEIEQALLQRVRQTWMRLGETRPHWSVNAREQFLPGAISENQSSFRDSGEEDARTLIACLARNGLRPGSFGRLVDFGCGVGRVTLPLARRFAGVTACDVSTTHLHVARLAAAEEGARNVVFSLVDAGNWGMTDRFDLWHSRVVLQHNPPPIIGRILRRAFALLAPGGVALFQVPTYLKGYRFRAAEYLATPPIEDVTDLHVMPQPAIFALAAEAGCVPLEVREDGALWPPTTVTSCTFLFRKP